MGLGQSSLPIWVPGTIEFIWAEGIPLYPHHKIISSQKYVFRDPKIDPKASPGQNVDLGVPKSDPGPPNPSPGMKKQKMRAEIPCRTPPSKNQTEPYGASYGLKPFWAGLLNVAILHYLVLFVCYFAVCCTSSHYFALLRSMLCYFAL